MKVVSKDSSSAAVTGLRSSPSFEKLCCLADKTAISTGRHCKFTDAHRVFYCVARPGTSCDWPSCSTLVSVAPHAGAETKNHKVTLPMPEANLAEALGVLNSWIDCLDNKDTTLLHDLATELALVHDLASWLAKHVKICFFFHSILLLARLVT